MAKKGGSTTATQALDPQMQQMIQQMFGAATQAGNTPLPGVNPLTTQAAQGFQGAANAGNLGFGALSGDPNALKSFQNPYQQNVIDAQQQAFDRTRAGTMGSIDEAATKQGAFGGSRHGVAQGVALGQIAQDENSQMAGLNQQGFDNAMGRAGQAANLGLGANGALAGLGEYQRGVAIDSDPAMHKYNMLKAAISGTPYGQTTTTKQSTDPWATALGGLTGLAGLFATGGLSGLSGLGGAASMAGDFGQGGGLSPGLMQFLGSMA